MPVQNDFYEYSFRNVRTNKETAIKMLTEKKIPIPSYL